jgi:gamma-glutamyl:cysteine ligase YbdK (ATP-grasp superfamily)
MDLFAPRTFSTDWEIMVVDKLERSVDTEKIAAFAGVLSAEFDLPIGIDWNTLEFAMGINTSLEQIWTRIQQLTDRAAQIVREFDLDLFPAGSHPTAPMFNSSHVHVGTIQDESAAIRLENQMLRYTPAFAALAANSPLAGHLRGEQKSYRVRHQAWGCATPGFFRDPQMSQATWGCDAAPKMYGAPTMEVRIADCASSRRFAAELAAFVAAYTHYRGTQPVERALPPREYRDCMTNRWSAARHGLQATFAWEGGSRPVVEVLDAMLDECRGALAALGVRRTDLQLIETMIRKRVCQADFALDLAQRYPDNVCLASAYAKLARHWNVFDEYLEAAPALEPAPLLDEEAIIQEHLALIGENTHFYRTREAMNYPPPVADEILERLIEQGLVRREVTERRGTVLYRRCQESPSS